MPNATHKLVESFATMLKQHGVPIREENNESRLRTFEQKLPKRLPQSFSSFLSRYSFPSFDVAGISLFEWESDSNLYTHEASAYKGSLSELMLPAGFVQIGHPDTGIFDAVCFDLNHPKPNREHGIVRIDHEDILCNWKVRVSSELWSSFAELMSIALSCPDPQVHYEEPII